MSLKIFINGEFVNKEDAKVSVFDHGLLYGDGIFEGIRSYNKRVFYLKEHIDRLYLGAAAIRLEMPLTKDAFMDRIIETLRINKLDDAYIRAVVTRGVGDLGLDPRKCPVASVFIIADKIKLYPENLYKNGMTIITANIRRNHPTSLDPRIKSLNYLNNILAKINAIDAGTEEALMLSVEGYVVECTGDNIFVVKDGKLLTPDCELGALEGITRKIVIELAAKRGITTGFVEMYPEEFFKADECFLTGTAAEIIPVIGIDKNKIGSGKPGEITKQLIGDFKELTNRHGVAY